MAVCSRSDETNRKSESPIRRLKKEATLWPPIRISSLASSPTIMRSLLNHTTDGVIDFPCRFGNALGLPESSTIATTEFVVPRSIPIAFLGMLRFPNDYVIESPAT